MTDYVNRWSRDPGRSLHQARAAERAVALDPSEPQAPQRDGIARPPALCATM